MSDIMLHGVLNMPPELWSSDPIDQQQRYSRYKEASEKLEKLRKLYVELTNSPAQLEGYGIVYFADQNFMKQLDEVFDG